MAILDDVRFVIDAICNPIEDESWTGEVLEGFADFVKTQVTPGRAIADAEGCVMRNGRVQVPQTYKKTFEQYVALGWQALALPASVGGAGAPAVVAMASGEILAAGDHAFELLVGLVPGAVRALVATGTPDQIAPYCDPLVSGRAIATMCLTEPQAGSDLGAIRTRATRGEDGKWRIEGEKIFISGGDQDMSAETVHLVLARTGTNDSGTKGLSLFVCGSERQDGVRNDIRPLRIEEKMGLHGSPTCHLRFEGAEAELLGAEGEGLKGMFFMMNHARLSVSLQGVGTAASATQLAHEYAATRNQGGRQISEHADVARMLIEMDMQTLAARALAYCAADSLEHNPDLAEFLTPVAKFLGTETASKVVDLGIQVMGGYGYLTEYGMERLWRDSRVTRIYEGTNGIQAMTLVKRLLSGGNGRWAAAFVNDVRARSDAAGSGAMAETLQSWRDASQAVLHTENPGFAASSFMEMTAMVYAAALWLDLERKADRARDPERIRQLARFWQATYPQRISALGQTVTALCAFKPLNLQAVQ